MKREPIEGSARQGDALAQQTAAAADTPAATPWEALHPRLQRQLRRAGLDAHSLDALPPAWPGVLARISRSYADDEQERYLLERTQAVFAKEMETLHTALQASQSRLASLVTLSSDWVWEQNAELRFTYVSGHDSHQPHDLARWLLGARLSQEVRPLDASDEQALVQAVQAGLPFRNLRFHRLLPEGGSLYLRLSGEPIVEQGRFAGYRGVGSDITQATRAEQQVLQLARLDGLTGLSNRSLFMAQLEEALQRARETDLGLALLFVDLDRFKHVNDTLGHEAGDELLKVLARRLAALLRSGDLVGRLGGDEFVLALADTRDRLQVERIAQRVLTCMCEPVRLGDRLAQVGASIGIALFPTDGADGPTLLRHADAAMYLAKARGKNQHQFFSQQLARQVQGRRTLEGELRQAVPRGELRLHYQPRYRVSDGTMEGLEALVRWQHPTRGLILPGDFIELAEDSGLIAGIGDWVLEATCRQLRDWRDAGLAPPPCAINLSVRQLAQDHLPDTFRDALRRHDLPPGAIEVEITETLLMLDADRAGRLLSQLHAQGITLAIDDFGSGYSSLLYLKRFPARMLKLDRSFTAGLPHDPDDAAITRAVLTMAHHLGLRVVAEGVERPEQVAFLREHGCDAMQGFLMSRPLMPDDLAQVLPRREGVV